MNKCDCAAKNVIHERQCASLHGAVEFGGGVNILNTRPDDASLIVVDFGESCGTVIKVEHGDSSPKGILGRLMTTIGGTVRSRTGERIATFDADFLDVKAAIDAQFAVEPPVPRLEYLEEDQLCLTFKGSGSGKIITEALSEQYYKHLNILAKQAGATQNLPIYDPQTASHGAWTRLLEEGDPAPSVQGHRSPVSIWRFTVGADWQLQAQLACQNVAYDIPAISTPHNSHSQRMQSQFTGWATNPWRR